MSKFVRLFFNRKKNASKEVAGAIEIVICLQRERAYFHTGHCVCIDQWKGGHQDYRDLCPPAHALRLAKYRREDVQGVDSPD